jgi:hypothetical protein
MICYEINTNVKIVQIIPVGPYQSQCAFLPYFIITFTHQKCTNVQQSQSFPLRLTKMSHSCISYLVVSFINDQILKDICSMHFKSLIERYLHPLFPMLFRSKYISHYIGR